ncbi:hypothetical protein Ndes2526B_g01446 [Nannochloris sp. 'desiccata']|nr:hypothetical protein KSW81_004233 [Chlorella desiccata (nom. nud.)]KAH7624187.1 putative Uncharacterized RNA methyltransferase CT0009 [Chlorella desiccata (nom. nud.)]
MQTLRRLPGFLPGARPRISCRSIATKARSDITLTAGDVINLECTDLAFGGDGVCKLEDGFVVFVPRALPGEKLSAKVTSAKSGFARARKLETLTPHDHVDTPQCQHFGPCGGCALQSLQYSAQVGLKEHQVRSLMRRLAGVASTTLEDIVRPIIPCEHPYEYRNRMEFSLDPDSLELGLHYPGSQDRVLSIKNCSLQEPLANEMLAQIQNVLMKHGVLDDDLKRGNAWPANQTQRRSSYSKGRDRDGPQRVLEHVVIRHSVAERNYLVNFVTNRDARDLLAPVVEELREKFKDSLAGCVNSVAAKGRPVAERRIAKEYTLEGNGYLVETLGGLEYEISPNAFFQVNTRQAEKLFRYVLEAAAVQPDDVVLDLYCGSGAITLLLAQQCRRAHGVEVSAIAVDDARKNARRNHLTNVKFTAADAAAPLHPKLLASDIIVVDPARPGLTPNVVESIRSTTARRVVYVSCNPSTQARDIGALCDPNDELVGRPFKLVAVQPVDMYPQTPHVESVAVLERI